MPNHDGGHYFYTGLFPIRLEPEQRIDDSFTVPSHLLREALAALPNFSEAAGERRVSPFARCHVTHFVRFGVIDDPAFNGRVSRDAILSAGVDPLVHQPVDLLSRPWLMMTADFDVPDGSDQSRDSWAAGLWELMQPELVAIFKYCCEFTKRDDRESEHKEPFKEVRTGADFAAYLARGQIETTMSFNYYWVDTPPMKDLAIRTIVTAVAAPAVLFALGAAWLRWAPVQWRDLLPWHWHWPWDWGGILLVLVAALAGLAVGAWLAVRMISNRGARAFPRSPDGDLKSVLKGLYLQQRLVDFAIKNQGSEPEDLHRAFGDFIGRVQPGNVESPSQSRGVLKA
jgi:hypothetical protein